MTDLEFTELVAIQNANHAYFYPEDDHTDEANRRLDYMIHEVE
jgi:hypothetical protein